MTRVNIYDPFKSKLSVEVTCEEKETTIVSMVNQSDKIIRMFSWPIKPGTNKTTLDDLDALPAGVYSIIIKEPSGRVRSQVMLNKEQ